MNLATVLRPALAGVWLLIAASSFALAQGAVVSLGVANNDSSAPVEITSETLQLDQESGQAEFTGDVLVVQGGLTMTTQRMLVEYGADPETGKNDIQVIRMFGGVTFVGENEAAESDSAVYTLADNIIVMTGNVLATQGVTALSADRLTYNLDTGEGQMQGNVKTVLQQANN